VAKTHRGVTMGENKEKVFEKIQKLMSLAGDNSSVEESASALRKAQLLMMKFNLSKEEYDEYTKSYKIDITQQTFDVDGIFQKNEGRIVYTLYGVIARYNLCHAVVNKYPKGMTDTITLVGSADNIEMVDYLSRQIWAKLKGIEKKSWSEYRGYIKRNKYRRDFLKGAIAGINEKLHSTWMGSMEDSQVEGLVVANDKKIEEYLKNAFRNLKEGRSTKHNHNESTKSGFYAGHNMELNKGLGNPTNKNPKKALRG